MESRISVVINTLNEEKNLPYALRSVQSWADEMVVVDMYSTDRTVEIARQFGAKVCLHPGPGFGMAPREFAVAQASRDWVFVLDADEIAPIGLSRELQRIAASDDADVFVLPRVNYFLGAPMKYSGWDPDHDGQYRFFKKKYIQCTSLVHRDFAPVRGARLGRLAYRGDNALVHFAYPEAAQWLEKMNRYTSVEAQQRLDRREHASSFKALVQATGVFLTSYLRRQGYRDGWRGFYVSALSAFYRLVTLAKLQALETVGTRKKVEEVYRRDAERLLDEYGEAKPAITN